jgi:hypothetical protein
MSAVIRIEPLPSQQWSNESCLLSFELSPSQANCGVIGHVCCRPITPLLAWEGLNSNDSRYGRSLHCWLRRGSIRMTADMTHYSTVGLGGALQYKLRSCKCIKHSRQMLTLTCNWVSRIVVILNLYIIYLLFMTYKFPHV